MGTTSPYIIYSESTPNPDVIKFVSNKILTDKSIEYLKIEDTENNTLIRKIFSLPFIKEIFISKNLNHPPTLGCGQRYNFMYPLGLAYIFIN